MIVKAGREERRRAEIRCGFVNIRNLTSEQKQKNILEYIQRKNIDIFGLMEVGLENESFKKIKRRDISWKDWKFEATTHKKQKHNRGVGVIMRREIAGCIVKSITMEGFFKGWVLAFKDTKLWVGWIYNPTAGSKVEREERKKLEESVRNFIQQAKEKENNLVLLGGDMNFNHNQEGRTRGLRKILEEINLIDIWKKKKGNIGGKIFFYKTKEGVRTGSRIDGLWGDEEIIKKIKKVEIIDKEQIGDITDHLGLELTVEMEEGGEEEDTDYLALRRGTIKASEEDWKRYREDERWENLVNRNKEEKDLEKIEETYKNIAKERRKKKNRETNFPVRKGKKNKKPVLKNTSILLSRQNDYP